MSARELRPYESVVKQQIRTLLRAAGAKLVNFHGGYYSGVKGTPDILGCYRGRFFAIEVKRDEHEQPRDDQLQQIAEWQAAGGIAFVAWSRQQVIDQLLKPLNSA